VIDNFDVFGPLRLALQGRESRRPTAKGRSAFGRNALRAPTVNSAAVLRSSLGCQGCHGLEISQTKGRARVWEGVDRRSLRKSLAIA
jgi:hypothetical protein